MDEDGLYKIEDLDMGPDWDAEYERYRDDWSESLLMDIRKLYTEYTKDKKGYYFGADERFVEHAISCLSDVSGCQLLPELSGHIRAKMYRAPRVEFVEEFNELKPKENEVVKSDEVQIKPGA